MRKTGIKYLIGIDEVGRGPLAGPVCLGFCIFELKNKTKIYKILSGIKDSKKLSEKQRLEWQLKIKNLEKQDLIKAETVFGSAKLIDQKGISKVITNVITRTVTRELNNLGANPDQFTILLDGGLKAPKKFKNQRTIIKGDEKEKIISVASIVAKIKRDNLMVRLSKKYPKYSFEEHKGYGTKKHIQVIKKYGLSDIHRDTFTKNIII